MQVIWYNSFVDETKPINIYIFLKIILRYCKKKNIAGDDKMEDLEKEVRGVIFDLIDNEDLKINDNDEIEYKQEWLNNWLMGWILDGYTTKEVMKVLECFENFYYEDEREVCDTVYYEDCNGGIDWYEENERIETFIVETKKVG